MASRERECPRCGASYDVRWRGCDHCGWRVPGDFVAKAIGKADIPGIIRKVLNRV